MVDKQAIIGGLFHIFATGGSGIRLVDWCRRKPGIRRLKLDLGYTDEGPEWLLELTENGQERFREVSQSLEGVVVRAVVALGKDM